MSLWTVKAHDLEQAQAQLLADLARETDQPEPVLATRGTTPGGDKQRLRGIPVVGAPGVPGHIPGTRP